MTGAAICAPNDRKAYMREYMGYRRALIIAQPLRTLL
jgi:hypothetical protein